MRIRATDERQRLWDDLEDATGHARTSQALDDAARLYVELRGDTTAVPTGRVEQLIRAAASAAGVTGGRHGRSWPPTANDDGRRPVTTVAGRRRQR
ncbi:hypothetical protein [Halobaculum sp. MBLA0143]|uniref:hypothetical protein n=1 Tax=Halobaculum sp. MBLA0143 TaxID=3079933 RepID=UPI003525FB51